MGTIRKKILTAGLVLALAALLILALAGCPGGGGSGLGQAIPGDAKRVPLAQVLADPAAYNGRTVLIEGSVQSQCASLCDFVLRDGSSSATIFPSGFKLNKLKLGGRVAIWATVTQGTGQVVLTALGLRRI